MVEKRQSPAAGASEIAGTAGRSARVLAVDDDPGVLLLLEETLVLAGFDVLSAGSGEEAVSICKDFRPDLVLLDINMPQMDGIHACEEIRRLCGGEFPIVMVTSVDDAMSIQLAFESGATDFILKPINWTLFQRRMESIMGEWNSANELNESNERLLALQRVAPEQVMLVSRNGVVIEDLKDRSRDHHPRRVSSYPTLDEIYGAATAARFKQCIRSVLKTCQSRTLRFTVDEWGTERECQAEFQVDGRERVIVVVQTVGDAGDAAREIYDLAFFDPLTKLPNGHLFRRFARKACADSLLLDRTLALVSIGFDTAGTNPLTDDTVVKHAAETLESCVRQCQAAMRIGEDENRRFVARCREDEFVVLLDNVSARETVNELAAALRHAVAELNGQSGIALSPVIGVAELPGDGSTPGTLLRAARAARQDAAVIGDAACFHSPAASMPALSALDYARELRNAIEKEQLELHFQPRVTPRNGQVTSLEALLRWNHPMRGYVRLGEILRLAKATGLIVEIGDWVMRSACEAALDWPGDPAPRVSVNLSRQEVLQGDLAGRLESILSDTGLDPARLELELTEAALLRAEESPAVLGRVKSLGIAIVLDDFGTGHSSLASLRDYPLDALKIDASFVSRAPYDSADEAICEIIVMMAHKMGLTAIAEGVETEAQLDLLLSQGCDEVQGYLIARPLPAAELAAYLDTGRPAAK